VALIASRAEGLDPDAMAAKVRRTDSGEVLRAFADQCRRG
jgi:hypothetical protein